MQSHRIISRLPQTLRSTKQAPMAFYGTLSRPVRRFNGFPQFPVADFAPFFRMFDEELSSAVSRPIRSWQPRFDVREAKDAFQLHGELPGVDSKDVQIEFADDNTMVIRGRTVREHTSGTKSDVLEAGAPRQAVEDKVDSNDSTANDAVSDTSFASAYKKPTVQDEDFVDINPDNEKPANTPTTSASDVAKAQPRQVETKTPESKYWVSERSVGEFHRTFTFPGKVDQDAVTASLKNGILSVVVPKAVAREPRKITVQ
jgi:HSP20 family protein